MLWRPDLAVSCLFLMLWRPDLGFWDLSIRNSNCCSWVISSGKKQTNKHLTLENQGFWKKSILWHLKLDNCIQWTCSFNLCALLSLYFKRKKMLLRSAVKVNSLIFVLHWNAIEKCLQGKGSEKIHSQCKFFEVCDKKGSDWPVMINK